MFVKKICNQIAHYLTIFSLQKGFAMQIFRIQTNFWKIYAKK